MQPTKLNLGCGLHMCHLPGWENIDNSPNARLARHPWLRVLLHRLGVLPEHLYRVPWPSTIRILDATRGLPFPENSIEVVYTSHMLEHLSRQAALRLVREAARVLRPGGILRVVVPDLERMVKTYVRGLDGEGSPLPGQGASSPADLLVEALKLVPPPGPRVWGFALPAREGSFHRWMYDFTSLGLLLSEGGFQVFARRGYLDSDIPEIAELEVAERAVGSLYVEARKT